jgi:glutathione S-transferase
MSGTLTLVSHELCPYVQRIAIALAEKGVEYERLTIDLADKPDWFGEISPLGRTPVLLAGGSALFESAAILEYLEETQPERLHPADPIARARHRAWIGFASECLDDIAGFYAASTDEMLDRKVAALQGRFRLLENHLGPDLWFDGNRFSLVDVVFAPVFRYFDVLDRIGDFGFFDGVPRVSAWRSALAMRASVRGAVGSDYATRLMTFLYRRNSALSRLMRANEPVYGRSA